MTASKPPDLKYLGEFGLHKVENDLGNGHLVRGRHDAETSGTGQACQCRMSAVANRRSWSAAALRSFDGRSVHLTRRKRGG
jgi:hypothetical protein